MQVLNDVEILVRCYNEEEWIIRCLEAINKQTILPKKIHFIDNESTDSSPKRVKFFQKKSKIEIIQHTYKNENNRYLPGKCLNKFINLVESKYTVFLSAHCVPANEFWLDSLISSIEIDNKIVAAYGRQIPTNKSDSRDARDLLWTFGKESRTQSKDIFFHNANSIALTKTLKKFPFDELVTNIEDRVWAHKIMSIGAYRIKYVPEAIVFHEHGIHQAGKLNRANQIVSIVNQITDKELFKICKSNLGCFIPYKASNDINTDYRKIQSTIKIALDLGFSSQNIFCSIDGNPKLVKKIDKDFVFEREQRNIKVSEKLGIKEILISMNDSCEEKELFFDDILLMEPNYTSRGINTIKKLINKYNNSSCSICMVSLPIKPHIWKLTQSKIIRIDKYELEKNSQEKITLAMRGVGMIFKVSQLRKLNWLDDEIEFVESSNAIECIPEK